MFTAHLCPKREDGHAKNIFYVAQLKGWEFGTYCDITQGSTHGRQNCHWQLLNAYQHHHDRQIGKCTAAVHSTLVRAQHTSTCTVLECTFVCTVTHSQLTTLHSLHNTHACNAMKYNLVVCCYSRGAVPCGFTCTCRFCALLSPQHGTFVAVHEKIMHNTLKVNLRCRPIQLPKVIICGLYGLIKALYIKISFCSLLSYSSKKLAMQLNSAAHYTELLLWLQKQLHAKTSPVTSFFVLTISRNTCLVHLFD